MAKLIQARAYWQYDDDGEDAVIIRTPQRGNRDDDDAVDSPHLSWGYEWKPKVGDIVRVTSSRDSDNELVIEPTDGNEGSFYIWDACIEPVNKPAPPIPDDVDLTNPNDIEQFLGT